MTSTEKDPLSQRLRGEVSKNPLGSLLSLAAVAVSVIALAVTCVNSVNANRISQEGLDMAAAASRKAQAAEVDGGILGPDPTRPLSASLCFRFYGYYRNLPGNARLWVTLQPIDNPAVYLTEVKPANRPSPRESAAVKATHSGAKA